MKVFLWIFIALDEQVPALEGTLTNPRREAVADG